MARQTELEQDVNAAEGTLPAESWVTIVWNDPVNLMSYVAYVFQSYFGYPRDLSLIHI